MNEHLKSFLNEEQDPKAIEKITAKLNDLLMKGEEVGYIGVQKKPAITVLPDSIVLTNKRIILCKPKNLGLSMDFTDYNWDDIAATFVKENILGSEFSFSTKTQLTISIDYIPKAQARKIYTYAKEQLDALKEDVSPLKETVTTAEHQIIEEIAAEEVTDYAELIPVAISGYRDEKQHPDEDGNPPTETSNANPSSEELFEKLQNYKKLLDNGLILQAEYDALKKEILGLM
ncbi:MAG TPA: PH domain-containing protein [Flavobacterium sp.]|nr:PH domain-containing protein [Flavobacterium sp.]